MSARPSASTSDDSFTHLGAEDWIVDAKIEAAFTDTHLWWHVAAGRWEDEWETMLRARVYAYLKTKVPADMYKDGEENDIRFIYAHVVNLNMDGSDEQIVDMQKKVLTFNKNSRPMKIWLDEYSELIEELNQLRVPVEHTTVRTVILSSLKGDKRYKDVLKVLHDHKE